MMPPPMKPAIFAKGILPTRTSAPAGPTVSIV
jgi:hypothetical protein